LAGHELTVRPKLVVRHVLIIGHSELGHPEATEKPLHRRIFRKRHIAIEAHRLGIGLHFDTHRYDGRFDLFNEVGKSDGTLCDFGSVSSRRKGRKAGLMEYGANVSARHTEAGNGSKEDKTTG
jgi:hypothetical protein